MLAVVTADSVEKRSKGSRKRVQKREESDFRQKNRKVLLTSQKKEQDTVAAGTNKLREPLIQHFPCHRSSDSPYSPFTTCWTTFTGSVEKLLLP